MKFDLNCAELLVYNPKFKFYNLFAKKHLTILDPRSKLADIFRPNSNKPLPTDKGGNIFLNRDPKCFRDISFIPMT